jgi:hypothetical protein
MADLAITARQLDKFLRQGKLDAEVHKLRPGSPRCDRAAPRSRTTRGAPQAG